MNNERKIYTAEATFFTPTRQQLITGVSYKRQRNAIGDRVSSCIVKRQIRTGCRFLNTHPIDMEQAAVINDSHVH